MLFINYTQIRDAVYEYISNRPYRTFYICVEKENGTNTWACACNFCMPCRARWAHFVICRTVEVVTGRAPCDADAQSGGLGFAEMPQWLRIEMFNDWLKQSIEDVDRWWSFAFPFSTFIQFSIYSDTIRWRCFVFFFFFAIFNVCSCFSLFSFSSRFSSLP